ncbi:MAG: LiaF transmembrane domain-containing protein [Arcticibacter sp.]
MENQAKRRSGSGMVAGVLFILFGVVMLIRTLGGIDFVPDWLISWPMILVVIGLVIGINHRFRKPGAYICLFLGLAFLAGEINPEIFSGQLIFPAMLLALGFYLMFGKGGKCCMGTHSGFGHRQANDTGVQG